MNTERTKQAIDSWTSREAKEYRYDLIRKLAQEAGLHWEVEQIPRIHLESIDYEKYMITIQGLAKIRELRRFNEEYDNRK